MSEFYIPCRHTLALLDLNRAEQKGAAALLTGPASEGSVTSLAYVRRHKGSNVLLKGYQENPDIY